MVSELELKEIIGKVLKEMAVEGTSVNNEVKTFYIYKCYRKWNYR